FSFSNYVWFHGTVKRFEMPAAGYAHTLGAMAAEVIHMKLIARNILIILLLTNCQGEKSNYVKTIDGAILGLTDKIAIDDLRLSWKEMTRCNCLFAKTHDNYWRKELFFARDSVGDYGLIQIGKTSGVTLIPILISLTQKAKGQEWTEVYSNDTLKIALSAKPFESHILSTYTYNVDFDMIHNGDTTKDAIIGYCRY
ncbi:MAG TPA: hypothetical protein VEW65_10750, partial [Chryseolinea sp.]|nr:hypothetical protein [Chryseolinea sp.]